MLVPVGSTRDIEFVADEPGDWALHCHMTHHVMNQMGHDIPNMIGIDTPTASTRRSRQLLPGYMTMGEDGMGGHGEHMQHMGVPQNSIPMVGADGPFGYIDMGGMFTILKVRDGVERTRTPAGTSTPRAPSPARRARPNCARSDSRRTRPTDRARDAAPSHCNRFDRHANWLMCGGFASSRDLKKSWPEKFLFSRTFWVDRRRIRL